MYDEIERFGGENFALYRIFFFTSDIEIPTTMNQNICFEMQKHRLGTRTLILLYNESSAEVFIEHNSSERSNVNVDFEPEAILILNHGTNLQNMNLFDQTFGAYERMESIDIYRHDIYVYGQKLRPSFYLHDIFINYCHYHLNRSFINTIWSNRQGNSVPLIYRRTVLESNRNYYKEGTLDYKLIEDETL